MLRGLKKKDPKRDDRPRPKERRINLDALSRSMAYFREVGIYDLPGLGKDRWRSISPPDCSEPFYGSAVVAGQKQGLVINERLIVVEAGSCLDYTRVAALIDGVPVLLIEARSNSMTVSLIEGSAKTLFGNPKMWIETVNEVLLLPEPLNRVMFDIYDCVTELRLNPTSPRSVLESYE